MIVTREGWLRRATELVDQQIFNGECDLEGHQGWQIACGWCRRDRALGETIFPYDGEDASMDDFFPVTIHINCLVKDPVQMIAVLAHECIHAFIGIHGHGRSFKMKAKEIGFEKPYDKYAPSQWLIDNCESIYHQLVEELGEFPGKPLTLHKKERTKERKKNRIKMFCPDCDYEITVSRKMFEKHNGKFPTCPCGSKMAQDLEDEEPEDQNTKA